jgi:hypothetical protein
MQFLFNSFFFFVYFFVVVVVVIFELYYTNFNIYHLNIHFYFFLEINYKINMYHSEVQDWLISIGLKNLYHYLYYSIRGINIKFRSNLTIRY